MTPDTTRIESALCVFLGLLIKGPPWWVIPSVLVLAAVIAGSEYLLTGLMVG